MHSESAAAPALGPLLQRLDDKPGFPALSESVAAINEITHAEEQNVDALSAVIQRDLGLSASILHVANSATYRAASGGGVKTISRAIGVLGFSTLRDIALTVVLFNQIKDHPNARELKEAFLRSQLAGTIAREAGRQVLPRQAEEIYTSALFYSLGQLLVLLYFPDEAARIRERAAEGVAEGEAARDVLGLDFATLGQGVATHWKFPESLVRCLRPLPEGVIERPEATEDMLWLLVGFGNEVCLSMALAPTEPGRLSRLRQRFAALVPLSSPQLHSMVQKSVEDTKVFASTMGVRLTQSSFIKQVTDWVAAGPEDENAATAAPLPAPAAAAKASPKSVPDDAQHRLSAGINRLSSSLVGEFALPEILRLAMDTLQEAMDFQRVLFCMRDDKSGRMVARMGSGKDVSVVVRRFHFPLQDQPDVFQLAIGNGVDIVIKDIADPKIADKIPTWYRNAVSARSFALMPLMVKGRAVGLIYCDKQDANGIVIPEKELALMKALRNQVLIALRQPAKA